MLKRAPQFLRVVDWHGEIDALDLLDLLDDKPRLGETVHAYRQVDDKGWVHICRRGKGQKSGYTRIATYEYIEQQPDEDVLNETDKWRQWCLGQTEAK